MFIENRTSLCDFVYKIIVGISGLLTLIFIILKLFNVVGWPWLLAFSPVWLAIVLIFIIGIIVAVVRSFREIRNGFGIPRFRNVSVAVQDHAKDSKS
jgi:hypothetical protein